MLLFLMEKNLAPVYARPIFSHANTQNITITMENGRQKKNNAPNIKKKIKTTSYNFLRLKILFSLWMK